MNYFEKYYPVIPPPEKDNNVEFIFVDGRYMRYCRESEDIIENKLSIVDKNASALDTLTEIYNFAEPDFIEEHCKEVMGFMSTRITSIEDISDVYIVIPNTEMENKIKSVKILSDKEVNNGN